MVRLVATGLVLAAACAQAEPAYKDNTELTAAERQFLAKEEAYRQWPDNAVLPVPRDGWYSLDLGGDTIDVFRDEYGVPHIFAPSLSALFRAQGYVTAEDRCFQIIKRRDAVTGRYAIHKGEKGFKNDERIREGGLVESELKAMLGRLPADKQRYFQEYADGFNAYLRLYAPEVQPVTPLEMAAGAVYFLKRIGDLNDFDLNLFRILSAIRMLKGDAFTHNFLDDCMPRDVPNAPTNDHSSYGGAASPARDLSNRIKNDEAPGQPSGDGSENQKEAALPFDTDRVVALLQRENDAIAYAKKEGIDMEWGSQAWAVSPERSASGNAMLFASSQLGYSVPSEGLLVHLNAPGLNVYGMAYGGIPGVIIGHNERLAWAMTCGLMDQADIYVEELNPENKYQYKYKGEWRDMEVVQWPMAVLGGDGKLHYRPYEICRTIHGPIVEWADYNNQAYAKRHAQQGFQVDTFAAFLDINFASNFDEFEAALRDIASSHNFFAADVDGNIGYWLTGRIPVRAPLLDGRLPMPGTGDCEWEGVDCGVDLVKCINPEEGWFGDSNSKPSISTPGWWPEVHWAKPIPDTLRAHDPIDWNTFVGINRQVGEYYFPAGFLKEYLAELTGSRGSGDPIIEDVHRALVAWPCTNGPGDGEALLFDEWVKELIVETLAPDLGVFVKPTMDVRNLQLFGMLLFRVLQPEKSGVTLEQDYLHGRDPDEIAWRCFLRALRRIVEEHGPDIAAWEYECKTQKLGDIMTFPYRNNCGTFWMAVELGDPIRSMDLLPPGQSGIERSPHYDDQCDFMYFWQLKQVKFAAHDFAK